MTAALSSALTAVLVLVQPRPVKVIHGLLHPTTTLRRTEPDAVFVQVAGTLLWLVAAWLAVGLLATLLATLPGRAGRLCDTASRMVLPGTLRRLVAGSAGLGVLLAPIPAAVAAAPGPPARSCAARLPPPVWPVAQSAAPTLPPPVWPVSRSGAHTPVWPSARSGAATLPPPVWPSARSSAATLPSPVWPRAARKASRTGPSRARSTVRVRAGDSLWLIAARRLGPTAAPVDIAAAWPRWYAANRAVIGPDPGLIRPGQELMPPSGPHGTGAQR